jgi:hypothetical protein
MVLRIFIVNCDMRRALPYNLNPEKPHRIRTLGVLYFTRIYYGTRARLSGNNPSLEGNLPPFGSQRLKYNSGQEKLVGGIAFAS